MPTGIQRPQSLLSLNIIVHITRPDAPARASHHEERQSPGAGSVGRDRGGEAGGQRSVRNH